MTLTPPTGLDAEKEPNEEAEEVTVDGVDGTSDDITADAASVAAAEQVEEAEIPSVAASSTEAFEIAGEDVTRDEGRPADEPSPSDEAVKAAAETDSTRVTPMPVFATPEDDAGDPTVDEEVTIARSTGEELARPSITEDEEEETKVETEETAIHAAAIRGDLESDLSAQASVYRDKALRKNSDLEFAEPHADLDDEVVSAGPVLDEDDDGIEVGAHLAPKQRRMEDYAEDDSMYGHSPGPSALVAALSARRPATPPTGTPVLRTDGFGSARLPTPVPGFVSLPVIGANLPAPASSPFGKTASVPGPYASGRSTSASMPTLQIPAPSGAAATAGDGAGLFRKVPIPVGGLAAVGLSCVVAGVIIGWVARGGGTPAAVAPTPVATTTAPRVAPAPAVPPPLVQPVGTPPAAAPTAVARTAPMAPRATAPTPAPEEAAGKPATPPEPEAAGEGASRSPAKRVAAKRSKTADDEEPTAAKQVASAKPIASKPAKTQGKTGKKVWIDPFAD